MHYFRTMVNIGFKMWQNPGRKNTPWKAKYIPIIYIYIYFDGKCKIAVEKFRSCSSQAEYVSLLLWQKTF